MLNQIILIFAFWRLLKLQLPSVLFTFLTINFYIWWKGLFLGIFYIFEKFGSEYKSSRVLRVTLRTFSKKTRAAGQRKKQNINKISKSQYVCAQIKSEDCRRCVLNPVFKNLNRFESIQLILVNLEMSHVVCGENLHWTGLERTRLAINSRSVDLFFFLSRLWTTHKAYFPRRFSRRWKYVCQNFRQSTPIL